MVAKNIFFPAEAQCLVQGIREYSGATVPLLLLPHTPPQLRLTPTMTSFHPTPPLGFKDTKHHSCYSSLFLIQCEGLHLPIYATQNHIYLSLDSKLCKNHMFIMEAKTEMKIKYQVSYPNQMSKRSRIAFQQLLLVLVVHLWAVKNEVFDFLLGDTAQSCLKSN